MAKSNVTREEYTKCSADVPGDTHRFLRVNTIFNNITYKHILLPIWIAAYNYKNKTYQFLVNGQTGEVQGEAPLSWVKIAATAGIVITVVVIIAKLAGLF